MSDAIKPQGENLRNAVRWLSEHSPITQERIDEASCQFDLTPLEEEFLFNEFLHKKDS